LVVTKAEKSVGPNTIKSCGGVHQSCLGSGNRGVLKEKYGKSAREYMGAGEVGAPLSSNRFPFFTRSLNSKSS